MSRDRCADLGKCCVCGVELKMLPREVKHELVALREGLKGIGERLGELSREMKEERREEVCPRCKRVGKSEEVLPEKQLWGRLRVGGKTIRLTPVEVVVMEVLLANRGEVVSREKILFNIYQSGRLRAWMGEKEVECQETAFAMALVRLRKKMKELPVYVETVRGVGLVLVNVVKGKTEVELS